MSIELFTNQSTTTVTSGGTTAPAAGTVESWTVASSASFPAASSTANSQFHVVEDDSVRQSEIIRVTNVSGTTWTVVRGAEGTATAAHPSGFTVVQTLSAGVLTGLQQVIAQATLTSAAATVVFSSIPSTFRHLRVLLTARSDAATTAVFLTMRFNSDTTASYDSQRFYATSATTGTAEAFAQTSLNIGGAPGASAGATLSGQADVLIQNYTGTTYEKMALSKSGYKNATVAGGMVVDSYHCSWRSTAVITSISLAGSAGNLAAGSSATLLGVL